MTASGPVQVHCATVVVPVAGPPVRDGAVVVDGPTVAAVGARADLLSRYPDAVVRDWPGVLTPGLVNAHTHLQYTAFADLAGLALAFPDWLARMAARRRTMGDADWAASVRTGARLALSTGTTAVGDVVSDPAALTVDTGLDGVRYLEVVAMDTTRWHDGGRDRFRAALDAASAHPVGVSPHSLYTIGRDVFADCVALARERGVRLHPHLAETAAEDDYVRSGAGPFAGFLTRFGLQLPAAASGRSPAAELDRLGGLGPDVHVAHGTHLDRADRALLRSRGTTVAVCVRSNAVLGAGTPPVAALLAEGSPVAVGTDSLASCASLDLLDELAAARAAALGQDPTVPDLDRRLVEAVTVGGAGAIGRPDLGVLRAGAPADFAVFDLPADGDVYRAICTAGGGHCLAACRRGRLAYERVAR